MKDQIIMFKDGSDIVDVIVGKPGPNSDINLWREQACNFDNNQRFIGDKAYVGEPQIETPTKKPKGGQLTAKQKEINRQVSRKRIGIEHLIRKCKVFRIASEKFRLALDKYEGIIKLIYGLVRFRIGGIVF